MKTPKTPYDEQIEIVDFRENPLLAIMLRNQREGYLGALDDLTPVLEAARVSADEADTEQAGELLVGPYAVLANIRDRLSRALAALDAQKEDTHAS